MKKTFLSVIFLAGSLLISGCDTSDRYLDHKIPDRDIHVLYFTFEDNIKNLVDVIDDYYRCTDTEIEPLVPYTESDVDFENTSSRAYMEQKGEVDSPSFLPLEEDISVYDVLFIGFPLWNETLPKIFYTFFDAYDFSGVTLVPFCVSYEDPISVSESEIRMLEPEAELLSGERFSTLGFRTSDVEDWLSGLYDWLRTDKN